MSTTHFRLAAVLIVLSILSLLQNVSAVDPCNPDMLTSGQNLSQIIITALNSGCTDGINILLQSQQVFDVSVPWNIGNQSLTIMGSSTSLPKIVSHSTSGPIITLTTGIFNASFVAFEIASDAQNALFLLDNRNDTAGNGSTLALQGVDITQATVIGNPQSISAGIHAVGYHSISLTRVSFTGLVNVGGGAAVYVEHSNVVNNKNTRLTLDTVNFIGMNATANTSVGGALSLVSSSATLDSGLTVIARGLVSFSNSQAANGGCMAILALGSPSKVNMLNFAGNWDFSGCVARRILSQPGGGNGGAVFIDGPGDVRWSGSAMNFTGNIAYLAVDIDIGGTGNTTISVDQLNFANSIASKDGASVLVNNIAGNVKVLANSMTFESPLAPAIFIQESPKVSIQIQGSLTINRPRGGIIVVSSNLDLSASNLMIRWSSEGLVEPVYSGLYVADSNVTLYVTDELTFLENYAKEGAAIAWYNFAIPSSISISASKYYFMSNVAKYGGAIYRYGSQSSRIDSTFTFGIGTIYLYNNTAEWGGAIWEPSTKIAGSLFDTSNALFIQNSAKYGCVTAQGTYLPVFAHPEPVPRYVLSTFINNTQIPLSYNTSFTPPRPAWIDPVMRSPIEEYRCIPSIEELNCPRKPAVGDSGKWYLGTGCLWEYYGDGSFFDVPVLEVTSPLYFARDVYLDNLILISQNGTIPSVYALADYSSLKTVTISVTLAEASALAANPKSKITPILIFSRNSNKNDPKFSFVISDNPNKTLTAMAIRSPVPVEFGYDLQFFALSDTPPPSVPEAPWTPIGPAPYTPLAPFYLAPYDSSSTWILILVGGISGAFVTSGLIVAALFYARSKGKLCWRKEHLMLESESDTSPLLLNT